MFSVIVPLYNKENFISRCIKSIKGQTFRDFEVWIVDDGSTDQSAAAALEAIGGDERFHIIRKPNGGVSEARNWGADLARGDWLAFLDADDEWMSDHLNLAAKVLRGRDDVALLSTGYSIIAPDKNVFRTSDFLSTEKIYENFDYFSTWNKIDQTPITSSNVFVRKTRLVEVGMFPVGIGLGEDIMTWINFVLRWTYLFAGKVTVLIHQDDPSSQTHAPSMATVRSHEVLLGRLADLTKQGVCPPTLLRKHKTLHGYFLVEQSNRLELMRFVRTNGMDLEPRALVMATLELFGVRRALRHVRQAAKRARAS